MQIFASVRVYKGSYDQVRDKQKSLLHTREAYIGFDYLPVEEHVSYK